MLAPDDRSPAPAVASGLAGGLAGGLAIAWGAAYLLPALAGVGYPVPALARPAAALRGALGVRDSTAAPGGYALTFDDGPHPQGTAAVLEVLARERAPATFFLVGEQVRRDPGLAREIAAAGHEIGLHCDRHRNLARLAPWQVRADIERAHATIAQATGRAPTLYRPPYGILNAAALRIARARGWRVVLWSHWGLDWRDDATPLSIAATLTDGAGEGSVLLLHDADHYGAPCSWRRTAAALPRVIATLAHAGLEPAPL
ncbi:MAG: polysaccharide deacetylase family protein [Solirubrobacterales bacterium]|nr:polysaccharide deacetylase family protein [Solirubrobacterales bacterium]